jgi:hypothetical protein
MSSNEFSTRWPLLTSLCKHGEEALGYMKVDILGDMISYKRLKDNHTPRGVHLLYLVYSIIEEAFNYHGPKFESFDIQSHFCIKASNLNINYSP